MSFSQRLELKELGWMKKICRTCGHSQYWHSTVIERRPHGSWCATSECVMKTKNGLSCTEFVPSDNLDYIEWLASKRGLV